MAETIQLSLSSTSFLKVSSDKRIYITDSKLTVKHSFPKRTVGRGLFAYVSFKPGDRICYFLKVDFITNEERVRREDSGCGGYMIQFSKKLIHDSFRRRDDCYASMANSPTNLVNVNGKNVISNARLVLGQTVKVASLLATTHILPFSEILWCYGKKYVYPK
jgi:hypothetical protein